MSQHEAFNNAMAYMDGWRCAAGMLGFPPDRENDQIFLAGWDAGKVAYNAAKEEAQAKTGYRFKAVHLAENREAFSLVEMCVVMAIIAVLIGLLVPAVQSVRESANRTTCTNHLKQIGLAAHSYHAQHRRLPHNRQVYVQALPDVWPGVHSGGSWEFHKKGRSWSWLAHLLPHLEQQGVVGLTFGEARHRLAEEVAVFRCPSDTAAGPLTDRANLEGQPIAGTWYKGVTGEDWCWGRWANRCKAPYDGLESCSGVFCRDDKREGVRFGAITDGLSSTFLAGEVVPAADLHTSWPYSNGAVGTCAIPVNSGGVPADWPNVYGFRSRHAGGAYFAFCDGSIRFVADTMPLATYRSLATFAGGETAAWE